MAYKYYSKQVFKAEVYGKEYVFTCYGQDTSYGFRHVCFRGDINYPQYAKSDLLSKASYYNRTWEEFTYQSVLRGAISKLDVDEQTRNDLYTILIKREAIKQYEQAEKDVKAFETLWNGLTEKNKQHIRNGLGDNLIQTEEQAKVVTSVMKMMTLFQNMEE